MNTEVTVSHGLILRAINAIARMLGDRPNPKPPAVPAWSLPRGQYRFLNAANIQPGSGDFRWIVEPGDSFKIERCFML